MDAMLACAGISGRPAPVLTVSRHSGGADAICTVIAEGKASFRPDEASDAP